AKIGAFDDAHTVHLCQPLADVTGQLATVHPHALRQVLGGGVELVQVVLPLVEVVANLLVRHRDRASAAAAVAEPVFGGRGQLRCGDPVPTVQVDHRAGQRGIGADDVGDLGHVDVDVKVAVRGRLAQLRDQPS